MAVKVGDRVLVSTLTVGQGSYQLGAAVSAAWQSFLDDPQISSGDRVAYVCVDDLDAPRHFEVGEGVITAGSPVALSRETIHRSFDGTTLGAGKVAWPAGAKFIFSAPSASRLLLLDEAGGLTLPGLLRLPQANEVALGAGTHALQIGAEENGSLAFDHHGLQARQGGLAAELALNPLGGSVVVGGGVLSLSTPLAELDPALELRAAGGLVGGGLAYLGESGRLALARRSDGLPSGELSIGGPGDLQLDGAPVYHGGLGPLAGLRNHIINGDFAVWQRGTSFAGIGPEYAADRWRKSPGTAASITVSRLALAVDEPGAPSSARFCARFTMSAPGIGASALEQRVESVRTLAGERVSLSFWARASEPLSLTLSAVQRFGTGGAPSAEVETPLGIIHLVDRFERYETSAVLPVLSGKTLGSDGNDHLAIQFRWPQAMANGFFDITGVQLEPGPVATPKEARPDGLELLLCKRYYQQRAWRERGYATAGAALRAIIPLALEMRAPPVVTITDNSANSGLTGSPAVSNITTDTVMVSLIKSGTDGLYERADLYKFDAEL